MASLTVTVHGERLDLEVTLLTMERLYRQAIKLRISPERLAQKILEGVQPE